MENHHTIKSFRQRLDVAVRSWLIMYDARFTKTFRDYGLPSADEFPLSSLAASPKLLCGIRRRRTAYAQAASILLGNRRRVEIKTPLESVVVDRRSVRHIVRERKAARERYAHFIRPTLEEPNEIWLHYDAEKKVYRRQFIKLFKTPDGKRSNFFAVVQENSDGNFLITAFPATTSYIDSQRAGVLLYGG